jgi:hypothetical protein
MPTKRTVDQIKANLLRPALTSHFEVQITKPPGLSDTYLSENGLSQFVGIKQEKLNLLCSETVLPGSSLATHEINNDFTGVTERHVYRRLYDDRIDLSFYVDAEDYLPIKFFETWIKYSVSENVGNSDSGKPVGSSAPTYCYKVNYPNLYISQNGLSITKFERDYRNTLKYNFVNVFPIAVSSMPVSYDASSLLKCSVSFSYIRYYITGTTDKQESNPGNVQGDPSSPAASPTAKEQAAKNGSNFGTDASLKQIEQSYGFSGGTGGVPLTAVNASGNTVNVQNFDTSKMTKTVNGASGGQVLPNQA